MQRHSQLDNRWRNTRFGVAHSTLTIGSHGCTVTAVANHTDNLTPVQVAQQASYVPDANIVWASINNIQGVTFLWRQWTGDYTILSHRIAGGEKAIVEIQMHSNGARWNHWLTVIRLQGDNAICIDPLNPAIDSVIHRSRITGSAFFSVVSAPKPKPPVEINQPPARFYVGDIAQPTRPVSYDGVILASFVTEREYQVMEVSRDRVVLGNGLNTAFRRLDLRLIKPAPKAIQPAPQAKKAVEPKKAKNEATEWFEETVKEEAQAIVEHKEALQDEVATKTVTQADKFDINKVMIDFARLNADKATYVASITVVLTQFNEMLNLGVSNGDITAWGSGIATLLIIAGVIRQVTKQ